MFFTSTSPGISFYLILLRVIVLYRQSAARKENSAENIRTMSSILKHRCILYFIYNVVSIRSKNNFNCEPNLCFASGNGFNTKCSSSELKYRVSLESFIWTPLAALHCKPSVTIPGGGNFGYSVTISASGHGMTPPVDLLSKNELRCMANENENVLFDCHYFIEIRRLFKFSKTNIFRKDYFGTACTQAAL